MARRPIDSPPDAPATPAGRMPSFSDGAVVAERPRLGPSPSWVYLWHRSCWTVVDGRVVPRLSKLILQGGVGQVEQARDGSYRIRQALAAKAERGWLPIRETGVEEYLREIDGMPGHYLSRWETAHAGTDRITVDTAGYVDWLRGKVDAGAIERPPRYALDKMRAECQQAISSLLDKVSTVPSAAAALKLAEAELAAIDAEIAACDEPTTPAAPVASRPARPKIED